MSSLRCSLQFSTSIISEPYASVVLNVFSHILQDIIARPETTVSQIDFLCDSDAKIIAGWNKCSQIDCPERCIDATIRDQCAIRPAAEAVCSHDGKLTYSELDDRSERLGHHLRSLGIGPEVVIPIYLEKSMWTIVSILGVLKAGAAFLLLDPSHPTTRMAAICTEVKAPYVITSTALEPMCRRLAKKTVVADAVIGDLGVPLQARLPPLSKPENAAYVAYTSGSTGRPKGIIIEHRSFCANVIAGSQIQNLDQTSRVLQFASYGFDISVQEMLATLMVGGCVCVPSETQRLNDLTSSITEFKANWIELTPSVVRQLSPQAVPGLKTLILGGECMLARDFATWADNVHLMVAYGPAECSVVTTVQRNVHGGDLYNIGRPFSAQCWVVEPRNTAQLQPIGAVGELVISGPIVGRGYLNQPSQDAFMDRPPWASTFSIPDGTRFYRTGDLAWYNIEDGSLRYVGRKDRQVKLNGQRVELQEVENEARNFSKDKAVVVDVVDIGSTEDAKALALFVEGLESGPIEEMVESRTVTQTEQHVHRFLAEIRVWLSTRLPQYMVPTLYIPLNRFPLTPTGKLDRRALKDQAAQSVALGYGNHVSEASPGEEAIEGHTEVVLMLRRLFAEVIGLPEDRVGAHDEFFLLGGNSVTAIHMVGKAREVGLSVMVADILTLQSPFNLAKVVSKAEESQFIEPLGLLEDPQVCLELAATECQLAQGDIEDIYPCTPLQEELMAISSIKPGSFIGTFVFYLPVSLDRLRFKWAWDHIVKNTPILRTRIVQGGGSRLLQVVGKEQEELIVCDSFDECYRALGQYEMTFGSSLARSALINPEGKAPAFVLMIHHAAFDGWSYVQLLQDLGEAYKGRPISQRPTFNHFIGHILNQNASSAEDFWRKEFTDCEASSFPTRPNGWIAPQDPSWTKRRIPVEKLSGNGLINNQIQLAWAMIISSHTNSKDVVLGTTVSGRNAPVAGIDRMLGPTIATFPLRIRLKPGTTVQEALKEIQDHNTALIPFEHTGMQRIRGSSPGAAAACDFQTLLTIHPYRIQSPATILRDSPGNRGEQQKFTSHILTVIVSPDSDALKVEAVFDASVLSPPWVDRLLRGFEAVLVQISRSPTMQLDAISILSAQDKQQISDWNSGVVLGKPRCMHDLIYDSCMSSPGHPAVHACDGSFTYSELLQFSRAISGQLRSLDIGAESIVAICMEKTRWLPVAVSGVLMAGAAFVLLDPTFPTQRLRGMCQETGVRVALSSPTTYSKCRDLARDVIALTEETASRPGTSWKLPAVSPRNVMYVAFTSGSTGAPKGAPIEHGMCWSTYEAYRNALSLSGASRVLHFSSLAFDAAVFELVGTLAAGACVCIPSEEQRLSHLAGAITDLGVDWVMLTPSVARTLSPAEIPSVRTLVLAGEPVMPADLQSWCGYVRLLGVYGPAEASIFTTITAFPREDCDATNVGRSGNSTCWVVNPDNHNQLQPVGAVGELVIAGPNVGRGYINRPQQTRASFIQNPSWVADFPVARDTRMYKTGDLVRYHLDGTLQILGRKDAQVKLHGQRIELREIEICAERSMPGMTAVADLIALPHPRIILFLAERRQSFCADRAHRCDDCTASFVLPTDPVHEQRAAILSHLSQVLPTYMIPSIVLSLEYFPLTPSGKINRRLLREEAGKLGQGISDWGLTPPVLKREPGSDKERLVRDIFAEVLALDKNAIRNDDSFFTLGGDSISAMRALNLCRKANLLLQMSEFLVYNSVSLFCQNARSVDSPVEHAQEQPGLPFRLSPIQCMFTSLPSASDKRFNQSFFLRVKQGFSLSDWRHALKQVVRHHSMLRARLLPDDREQVITSDIETSFRMSMHDVEEIGAISTIAEASHSALNIRTGPVISLDIIHVNRDEQYALFIGHHLVVDLVSWRFLLSDIQDLLQGKPLPLTLPYSFQWWVSHQRTHSQGHVEPKDVLPFDVHCADYNYWGFSAEWNTFGETCSREFLLDETTTAALVESANTALGSHPQELFQAALLHSWAKVFPDRKTPTIFTEGHGREPFDPAIDLSRTVGWFTTMRPCTVEVCESMGLPDLVRCVKDTSRSLPGNGLPYFSARYLDPRCREAFSGHSPAEVLLNYAGRYQQLESDDSIFSAPTWKPDPKLDVAHDLPRFAIFDVVIEVAHGRLHVSVWYCKHTRRREAIQRWIREYQRSLCEVAEELSNLTRRLTLSDIPLARMTYDQLDALDREIRLRLDIPSVSSIESIYPCSKAHAGLIHGLTGTAASHAVRSIWEIKSPIVLDAQAVADAWLRLIRRHTILRTILVRSPGDGRIFHVVLKDPRTDVQVLPCSGDISYERFRDLPRLLSWETSPAHRFAVTQTSDGRILALLESGKAYIDGMSLSILQQELCLALRGELPRSSGPLYCKYIAHLTQQPSRDTQSYWETALKGMRPCLFPSLVVNHPPESPVAMHTLRSALPQPDRLNSFWRSTGLTVTNIFQLAWGLVLQQYCRSPDVCFGSLVSGRDIPMPDIAQIVGPCFNVLPCRLVLDANRNVVEWLRQNQAEMERRTEHQHCSVPDTLRSAGFGDAQAFNSCLSVQSPLSVHSAQIEFQLLENHDPTEVSPAVCLFIVRLPKLMVYVM